MIIVLKLQPSPADVEAVEKSVRELGYEPHRIVGEVRTVIACIGDETTHKSLESLATLPMVESVMPVQKKFKLISRETHPEPALVKVAGLVIGGNTVHIVGGPCSVESREQILVTARAVKAAGGSMLRGGAYKPRTSPYDFQGLGEPGLALLKEARDETGLPVITEVVSEMDMAKVAAVADVLQIGARNGLNYSLLSAAADTGKPILLKRGMMATISEWLLAAEYIAKRSNRGIILCERGIRTFETATRNTLDLSAVAVAKKETCLPVFVDPTHAAGRLDLIEPLSKAAIAVGADGLLVEVHPDPKRALSDAAQQMLPEAFVHLMQVVRPIVSAVGRTM
ncbi:MAG: 3-deoxy-7-phosphoheptulonate synthase [Kiritimatiellia bacterium]